MLIVDDDKLIRWSLKEIFAQEGFKVDTAESSAEALSLVETNAYHLILADFEIDDENGGEMLRKIQAISPGIKVIILSALPRQQIEPHLSGVTYHSILEKPFRSDEIKSTVGEALDLLSLLEGVRHKGGPAPSLDIDNKPQKQEE
jgi:two-component system response regulator HydG